MGGWVGADLCVRPGGGMEAVRNFEFWILPFSFFVLQIRRGGPVCPPWRGNGGGEEFWILDFGIPSWEACAVRVAAPEGQLAEVGRGGSARF